MPLETNQLLKTGLTVRDAARIFEAAGVARTERSIVNWCQPNPQGVARLDAFYDSNERRWFITPQSVERAVEEERAKAARGSETVAPTSESLGTAAQHSDSTDTAQPGPAGPLTVRIKKLEQEVVDLKILNGGKDLLIDQLRGERAGFIQQIATYSREAGQLETKLNLLSSSRATRADSPPSEAIAWSADQPRPE